MNDKQLELGLGLFDGDESTPADQMPTRRHPKRAARDRSLIDHPQTGVKLTAYGNYLPEWLDVAASQDDDIYIDDLFAGPGLYAAGEGKFAGGSPVIACDSAIYVQDRWRGRGRDVRVHLRFVEPDRKTREILIAALAPYTGVVDYVIKDKRANDWAATFADESKGHPTLVLLDPDGYKDVPFSLVRLFAGRPFTELLISFDVQGSVRAAGIEAPSLTAFCGDDMWRRDRDLDGTINIDKFLEGYRRRLGQRGMFARATIRRIVFNEVHANRAIAQACGSEKGVRLWKRSFVAAYDSAPGTDVFDIVHQIDRRTKIDTAIATLRELSGAQHVMYGAIAGLLDGLDLGEAEVHQVLLFLREAGAVAWTSRLHRLARPAPRFTFREIPERLRWDGVERQRESARPKVVPGSSA